MSATNVLVTGAGGFHGSGVTRFLAGESWARVHGFYRRYDTRRQTPAVRQMIGDVEDLPSLLDATRGIDVVVHCATYVGYDPDLCGRVNVLGTQKLVRAALESGVQQIIYISTCGVYGRGESRGLSVEELTAAPTSVLSQSRLDAESIVLEAGGLVLRPNLVYGIGDRWFVPSLASAVLSGPLPDGGDRFTSLINVWDLARLVGAVIQTKNALGPSGIAHAALSSPVSFATISSQLRQSLGLSPPVADADPRNVRTERAALDILSVDRWYSSTHLWEAIGLQSPSGFHISPSEARWYRSQLTPSA